MRLTWGADQVLLPTMQQWVAHIASPSGRTACAIAIRWSVPLPWRSDFVQLLSALVQAQQGRFTRQAYCFMRTALRVAQLCGRIIPVLTAQVVKLGRLSRWNMVPTPLDATPRVWPAMRREIGSSEQMHAHTGRYIFHDEQQGYSRVRSEHPLPISAYVITGTYHPQNYLLQFPSVPVLESEEVD